VDLKTAIGASELLNEKSASLRTQDSREKAAAADFAAFALVKQAGAEELWQLGKKPLAWGLGLGLPALGAGHALISDAHAQGKDLIRDARNQALLTAAGVGGMQSLGNMLGGMHGSQQQPAADPTQAAAPLMPYYEQPPPGGEAAKLSALIMVDDLLENAYEQLSGRQKSAALAGLAAHRIASMRLVRSMLR
jgi:hypothetical protein